MKFSKYVENAGHSSNKHISVRSVILRLRLVWSVILRLIAYTRGLCNGWSATGANDKMFAVKASNSISKD